MGTDKQVNGPEFDDWLEQELDKGFAALSSRPVPAEPRYRAARPAPLFARLPASRLAGALLGAAVLAGGGTAVAAAAAGTSPVVLAQRVPAAVTDFVQTHRPDRVPTALPTASSLPPTPTATSVPRRAALQSASGSAPSGSPSPFGQSVEALARATLEAGESHGETVSSFARSNNPGAEKRAERATATATSTPSAASASRPGNSGNTPAGEHANNGNGGNDASQGGPDSGKTPPGQGNGSAGNGNGNGNASRPGNSGNTPAARKSAGQ